uniref:Transcription repressor n=1 Tax=Rhizophora mucronata TaxID=61149 RepID=A0A2P2N3W3_RHIMU
MVEMIVEKRIYAAKDLEQLLQCFLSLNSYHHHGIIVEVFAEILDTLFST